MLMKTLMLKQDQNWRCCQNNSSSGNTALNRFCSNSPGNHSDSFSYTIKTCNQYSSSRPLLSDFITIIFMVVFTLFCLNITTSNNTAYAQMFGGGPKPTVIENARIITMNGTLVYENGKIMLKGGIIQRVGNDFDVPKDAKIIDAAGMTITPGFIDVNSRLGLETNITGGQPINNVFDSFDRYATNEFRDAVRNGVTAIYLPITGNAGINGTGAVVRLVPHSGGWAGDVILSEAALHINMGSDNSPIVRIRTYEALRKQFKAALDYRETKETYEEDLKEYEEKVLERAKKEAEKNGTAETNKDAKSGGSEPKSDVKIPDDGGDNNGGRGSGRGGGGRRPTQIQESYDFVNEYNDNNSSNVDDNDNVVVEELTASEIDSQLQPRPRRGPRGGGGGEQPAPPPANKENKEENKPDEDGIKKPTEPDPDPASEIILKAIDRDIPVRVFAQRSSDILNVLDLAKEYEFDLIIEGAAEAYLVADEIAEAEVPVVLGQIADRSGLYRNDAQRRRTPDIAARLTDAGIKWVIGSGADAEDSSRFVFLNAQLAARYMVANDSQQQNFDPLKLVTADAADFLGVSDKIGRIAFGKAADLVFWDGDPRDPQSRVQKVYIDGKLVYKAAE